MKIIVNNEKEFNIINSFCDLALKVGGVQNLVMVNLVVASIEKSYTQKREPKKPKDVTTQ